MERSKLLAEVIRYGSAPESWAVEAIAMDDDGAIERTLFSGPKAKRRAEEYAAAKYNDYRVSPVAA